MKAKQNVYYELLAVAVLRDPIAGDACTTQGRPGPTLWPPFGVPCGDFDYTAAHDDVISLERGPLVLPYTTLSEATNNVL